MTALDDLPITPTTTTVRAACPHDCPDTCAMLVTVEDGRATKVAGDPDHPFTRGGLCVKVNNYHGQASTAPTACCTRCAAPGPRAAAGSSRSPGTRRSTRSPTRSGRGSPSTVPRRHAGQLPRHPGHPQRPRRSATPFFNKLGATSPSAPTATPAPAPPTRCHDRRDRGRRPGEPGALASYIIIWACNTISHEPAPVAVIAEAQKRGAKVVVHRPGAPPHRAARRLAHPDPPRHRRRARAGDDARDHRRGPAPTRTTSATTPSGSTSSPSASRSTRRSGRRSETGIPAEDIRTLAREYATTDPSMIRIGVAIERHAGGGQTVRVARLPARAGRRLAPRRRRAAAAAAVGVPGELAGVHPPRARAPRAPGWSTSSCSAGR